MRADGRPPARDGITARRVVLTGAVPAGEFWAARAGDSPFTPGELLAPGAQLARDIPAWVFPELAPEPAIPFESAVIFEDDELIVVDKPHFLPSTSNGRIVRETVQTRLRQRFGEEVTVLHRLDRLTAGVLVCSRNPRTRGQYQQLFSRRQVRKRYLARVEGTEVFGPEWRTIRLPMAKTPGERQVTVEPSGTETVTRLRGIGPHIVELDPVTGHTHQLRVLLNHLGAPITGDDTYPVDRGLKLYEFSRLLHLLARSLSFTDPISGHPRAFVSQRSLPDSVNEQ